MPRQQPLAATLAQGKRMLNACVTYHTETLSAISSLLAMAHGEYIQQQPVDITTNVEKSSQDTSRKAKAELADVFDQPALARDRLAGMEQLDAQALRDAAKASAGAVKIVQDVMSDRLSST
eukprot:923997-Amphidinium_carterae.1